MTLRRGGYCSGELAYSKLLKVRVMPMTYNELLDLQKETSLSMSQLLRKLIGHTMDKVAEEGSDWI